MIAMIVLAVVTCYLALSIALAVFARRWAKTLLGKWINSCAALLVMFLIPTWDIPIGKINFNRHCDNEAGISVNKRVGLTDDYYIKPGTPVRKTIHHEDGVITTKEMPATGDELDKNKIEADFTVDHRVERDVTRWGRFDKYTTTIRQENDVLGSAISFRFGGGWLDKLISFTEAAGGPSCPEKSDGMNIHVVFIYDGIFYRLRDNMTQGARNAYTNQ